jgi:heme exporter protein A
MITAAAQHEPPTTARIAGPPAVRITSLRKVIDDRVVLRDLDVSIEPGSFVALLGANGAGKSTLLKILAGLMPATVGTIELFGQPLRHDSPALRSRIGLIGHSAMLYRELSAKQNLVFFGRLHGLRNAAARADELLANLGLAGRAHDAVKTFSRGMVQRVAIARALLCDPDLLLADEPFSGLDAPSSRSLEEILAALHQQGKTIILANHDVAQSLMLAERTLVLHQGRLVIDEASAALRGCDLYAEVLRR